MTVSSEDIFDCSESDLLSKADNNLPVFITTCCPDFKLPLDITAARGEVGQEVLLRDGKEPELALRGAGGHCISI